MKLIIQIPCLNEFESLPQVLAELPRSIEGIDTIETLVIDDGSVDGTPELAKELGVTYVVRHTCNRGLAEAYASGVRAALMLGADIIVNTDGDNQYPGASIAQLVLPIILGRADIVIGDRKPGSDLRTSLTKRVLQRLGSRIFSLLAGRSIPDPVSGFRALSRDAAFQVNLVSKYSYTIESLLQATNKKLAVEFVAIQTNPVQRPSRLFRSIPHFVLKSASTMLRIFFMYHSFQVLLFASFLCALAGLAPVARFLILWWQGYSQGHVQSLVLGAALLVLSAIIFAAGLLADLLSSNRAMIESVLERVSRAEAADLAVQRRAFQRFACNSDRLLTPVSQFSDQDIHSNTSQIPTHSDTCNSG